jgi:hypothetical protein
LLQYFSVVRYHHWRQVAKNDIIAHVSSEEAPLTLPN